jgi:protein-L-isoaspartate(D-aspartate) O-methyltransferase
LDHIGRDKDSISVMNDYAQTRINMVDSQLRTNKVTDPAVIDAFLAVAREDFVPAPLKGIAYVDEDLLIGGGRYLIEPMVLARLIQEAAIEPSDRVLDVGGGTGYAAAILARLANAVIALEEDAGLAAKAKDLLASIANVTSVAGPLAEGWQAKAPYDVILINGTVDEIPDSLTSQLANGGRVAAVVRPYPGGQAEAIMFERVGTAMSRRALFDASVPELAAFRRAPAFSF